MITRLVVLGCLVAALVEASKEKGQAPRGVQPHNFFGAGGFDGFGTHVAPVHGYTGINFDEGPAQKLAEPTFAHSAGVSSHGFEGTIVDTADHKGEAPSVSYGAPALPEATVGQSLGPHTIGAAHGVAGQSFGGHAIAGPALSVPSFGGHGIGYGAHGFGYGAGQGLSPYGGFGGFGKGYGKLAQPMYVLIQDGGEEEGKGKGKGGLFGKGKGGEGKGKGKGKGSDNDYDMGSWSHDYDYNSGSEGKGKGKGKGGLFKELEKGFKSVSNYWNDYMAYNNDESAGAGYGPQVFHANPIGLGHGYGPGIGHGFGYAGVSHGHSNDIQVAPPIVGGLGHFKAHGVHPGFGAYVGSYGNFGNTENEGKGKGGKSGKSKGGKGGKKGNEGGFAPQYAIAAPIGGHGLFQQPIPYGYFGGHAGYGLGHNIKAAQALPAASLPAPAIPAPAPIIAPKAPSLPAVPAPAPILHAAPKAPIASIPQIGHMGLPGYGGVPINLGGHQAFALDYDEEYDDGWFSSGYNKMKKEFDKAYKGVKGLFSDDKGKGGKGEKGMKGGKKGGNDMDGGQIVLINKPLYAPRPPFHKGFFAQPGYGLPGAFHGLGSFGAHGAALGHAAGAHDFGVSKGIALDGDVSYSKGVQVVETKTNEVVPAKATQTSFSVTHTSGGSTSGAQVVKHDESDENVANNLVSSSYASHK